MWKNRNAPCLERRGSPELIEDDGEGAWLAGRVFAEETPISPGRADLGIRIAADRYQRARGCQGRRPLC